MLVAWILNLPEFPMKNKQGDCTIHPNPWTFTTGPGNQCTPPAQLQNASRRGKQPARRLVCPTVIWAESHVVSDTPKT